MAKRLPAWLRPLVRWTTRIVAGLACIAVLQVLSLRWLDPPTSAYMLAARLNAADAGDNGYRTRYQWVDLERIAPHAAIAVIAAEDQLFPIHVGFDFESIRKAVQHNANNKRRRGASTISQQVARNLYLWEGGGYFRKSLEALYTLMIEWLWPKERILEVYLNIAEFGRGTYGVQAAALRYFGKEARRLDHQESALLAAVLPSPRRFRVEAPSPYVQSRRDWILTQMAELGGTAYLDRLNQAQSVQNR